MSKCNLVVNKNPRPLRNPRFPLLLPFYFFFWLRPKAAIVMVIVTIFGYYTLRLQTVSMLLV